MASNLATAIQSLEDLEWLEGALLGKAAAPSILTDDGFVRAALREARLLIRQVGAALDSPEVQRRLRASTTLDWRGATPAQRDEAVLGLSDMIRGLPSAFLPGVTQVLDNQGRIVVGSTHVALGRKPKEIAASPTFVQRNTKAVGAISQTTSIFFPPEYEAQAVRFRRRAQDTISRGLNQGFGRVQIGADLRDEFAQAALHESYWETVAAVHVNRARSFSNVATYAEAGVTSYEVLTVDDERRTDICEMMDGKILSVDSALSSFDAFEGATDLDEVKNKAAPFMRVVGGEIQLPNGTRVASISQGGFSNVLTSEKMNQGGIDAPPYHHRCRSTVMPVFEEDK